MEERNEDTGFYKTLQLQLSFYIPAKQIHKCKKGLESWFGRFSKMDDEWMKDTTLLYLKKFLIINLR